jgi:hypothetical protein
MILLAVKCLAMLLCTYSIVLEIMGERPMITKLFSFFRRKQLTDIPYEQRIIVAHLISQRF